MSATNRARTIHGTAAGILDQTLGPSSSHRSASAETIDHRLRVLRAAINADRNGYSQTQGIPDLRERLQADLRRASFSRR